MLRILRFLIPSIVIAISSTALAFAKEPETKKIEIKPAPEFDGLDEWINTEPLTMKELKGRVVVLHFWTFGCINCIHNLPHYQQWQKDFAGKDLVIVGIHTPETESEKKPENVRKAVKEREIEYPVAIDGKASMWKTWGTRMWPSVALIDRQGRVRYVWEGELNWEGQEGEAWMRGHIKELLAEGKGTAKTK
jgi:thiol-disulfide isomerase/thioredoxin